MKLSIIVKSLHLKIMSNSPVQSILDTDIKSIYTGDLLSDIMGNAPAEALLITIQAHKNTVAVATLKDSPAIIICNNRTIPDEMKVIAEEENIMLFTTDKNQYEISGLIYALLHPQN